MTENQFANAMQRMAAGDQSALKEVYDAYLKIIYAVIYNVLKHKENAEDLTSEYFIKLFKNAASFKANGHHKAWMVTIAKNMCIDFMRKNSHEVASINENYEEDDTSACQVPSVETHENAVVAKLTVEQAMQLLNENEKMVVDMKIVGGFTFKEISEAQNMPMGTVTWLYNNGIKKLRRYLQNE